MSIFSRRKTQAAQESKQDQGEPKVRKIPAVNFLETDFDNIEPDHMDIFLNRAYADPEISLFGKELIGYAYGMNRGFRKMEAQFGEHKTFGEWKKIFDDIVNTGRVSAQGDEARLNISDRGVFIEAQKVLGALESCYDGIRKKDKMYF